MADQQPVTREWIAGHVANEVSRLPEPVLRRWEAYAVEPWVGHLNHRPGASHKQVYVVAERGREVLYWDDIENQFARGTRVAAQWVDAVELIGARLSWALQKFHPAG